MFLVYRRRQLHFLCLKRHRYQARPGHFNLAIALHRANKCVQLLRIARGFERVAFRLTHHRFRAEDLGFLEHGHAVFLSRPDPQQDQLPPHG